MKLLFGGAMKHTKYLTRISLIVLLVSVAVFQIGGCNKNPSPPIEPRPTASPAPAGTTCNCSVYDLVCTMGISTCVETDCERVVYKDGVCSLYSGPAVPEPLRADTAELFDIAFSSYQEAVKTGNDSPDANSWAIINDKAPNEEIANAVRYMTNDFLYISLARDFKVLTHSGLSGDCGFVSVSDKNKAASLIEAIKTGTMNGVKNGTPASVKKTLNAFFADNPDFKPVNQGYCYSGGNAGTPADCIGRALESRIKVLLGIK